MHESKRMFTVVIEYNSGKYRMSFKCCTSYEAIDKAYNQYSSYQPDRSKYSVVK